MYILLNNNNVAEIIPDENPAFPGVPIESRYAPAFVANLIHVDDTTEVAQNWVYDAETGTFSEPPEPEPVEPVEPEQVENDSDLSKRVSALETAILTVMAGSQNNVSGGFGDA